MASPARCSVRSSRRTSRATVRACRPGNASAARSSGWLLSTNVASAAASLPCTGDASSVPTPIMTDCSSGSGNVCMAGSGRDVVVYRVDVEIDGLVFPRVEALAVDRTYALLGRNLLRVLVVRLDGPREWLDLRRPRIKT